MKLIKKEQLIRVVKNKRSVFYGEYKNIPCVIKLFEIKNDYLNELNGILLLLTEKVLTPELIFSGLCEDKWCIITKRILNSKNVYDYLKENKNQKKQFNVIKSVLEVNKKLAAKNIVQVDNYLKNYLIDSKDNVYVLDGGQVIRVNKWNFISKVKFQALIFSKLDLYQFNNFKETAFNIKSFIFNYFVQYHRYRQIIKYKKKCLRNSSDFSVTKNKGIKVYGANDESFDLSILNNLEKLSILKDGNSSTVFLYKDLVIKRYNIQNFWQLFKFQFCKNRAVKSWQACNVFNLIGIPSAKPVCLIVKEKRCIAFEYFFVSKKIEGINLFEHLDSFKLNESKDNAINRLTTSVLDLLYFYKVHHSDLKFSNILINNKTGYTYLIDYDSVKFFRTQFFFKFFHKKDKIRLFENFIQYKALKK